MSNIYYNVQLKNPKEEEQFWYPLTLKNNVVDLTTFVGATTIDGVSGLVPAPKVAEKEKFLKGDGSWQTLTDGDSVFLSYSSNSNGSNNHSSFISGDKYIGIYVGQTAPQEYTGYTWCKFVGDDGTSVTIKGSLSSTSDLANLQNPTLGDGYIIDGNLWVYTGTQTTDTTHISGFENVGQIRGPQGAQGPAGADGADGKNGNTWYSGTDVEGESGEEYGRVADAVEGDYYINTNTYDIYICTTDESGWEWIGNIKGIDGTNGTNGATWNSGIAVTATSSSVPTGMKVGDYYLNTSTYDVWKCLSTTASTKWSLQCNIKGTTGLSIYSSSDTSTSATTSLIKANITTSGRSLQIGDLVLTSSNDIFKITAVGSGTTCTVSYVTNIQGDPATNTTYKFKLNNNWTTNSDTTNGLDLSKLGSGASATSGIYAPTDAGTSTNLFLKWDTTNSKPIWTTLSSILGSTSGNLLLGDGSTLTKAITTTKINGTSYTALSDTGSAQTQTDSIYAPISGTTSTVGASIANQLLISAAATSAPTWTSFTFPSTGTNKLLSYTGGTGWSLVDTVTNTDEKVKQTADATSTLFPMLTSAQSSPTSTTAYEAKYSTATKLQPSTGSIIIEGTSSSVSYRTQLQCHLGSTTPVLLWKLNNGTWETVSNKIITSDGLISAPPTSSDGNKYLRAVISSGTTTFGWKNGLLETVQPSTDYLGHLASHPQGGNDSDQLCVPQTTYVGNNGGIGFFRGINGSYGRVSFQGNLDQPILIQQGIAPTYSAYTTIENEIITSNGVINAPSTANRYLKWTGNAFTWDTAGGTVPGVASTASGADNPGLLKVQYDANANIGTSEQTLISPVPIFYGVVNELWLYNNGVRKDIIGNKTWHYINIYSIIEAIKNDDTLKKAFQDALSN